MASAKAGHNSPNQRGKKLGDLFDFAASMGGKKDDAQKANPSHKTKSGGSKDLHPDTIGDSKKITPIPKDIEKLLKQDKANFSLSFVRLMQWNCKGGDIEKNKESVKNFCVDAQKKLLNINAELETIHERQKEAIKSLGELSIEISATLTAPFISGLGSGHPNETGMILDRNTGCPFLPASSIKGVLRLAYALKLADDNHSIVEIDKDGQVTIDDKYLDKYFGSTDTNTDKSKRGELVILDAYPKKAPKLKLDIMNPHYPNYYSGKEEKKKPIETENPVPIKFISIAENTEFTFRAFFLPLNGESFDQKDKDNIEAAFEKAFKIVGFGGKTAIGYGRFKINEKQ
jgi:CRISPR-associated protein Cmr6